MEQKVKEHQRNRYIGAALKPHTISISFIVRSMFEIQNVSARVRSLQAHWSCIRWSLLLLLLLMLVIFFTFANYTMSAKNVFNGHVATKVCCAKRDIVRTQAKIIRPTKHQRKKKTRMNVWIELSTARQPEWIEFGSLTHRARERDSIWVYWKMATKRKHWIYSLAYHQQLDTLTWYRLLLPLAQVLFHSIDDPIDSALMDIRVELKRTRKERDIIRFFFSSFAVSLNRVCVVCECVPVRASLRICFLCLIESAKIEFIKDRLVFSRSLECK